MVTRSHRWAGFGTAGAARLRALAGWFAALGLLGACGGSSATPTDATSPASTSKASTDPGARCLEIANAERVRSPKEPISVGIAQLLVHHAAVKRPAEGVQRSRVEACLRAMEARDALRAGADFDELVARYSDEAGAASRGGKLGSVRREELVAPFADAAFELDVGQLSDVVETELGFHLILRVE
jgi:peptidyl-prolyl cis-trans isomerase NIMA-interacting 1